MNKATLIITEKRNISNAIVRALAPDTFDERGNCSVLHSDIVSHRTRSQIGSKKIPGKIKTLEDINCEKLQRFYSDLHDQTGYFIAKLRKKKN